MSGIVDHKNENKGNSKEAVPIVHRKIVKMRFAKMVAGVGSSIYLRPLYNLWCWESIAALAFCHRVLERVGLS